MSRKQTQTIYRFQPLLQNSEIRVSETAAKTKSRKTWTFGSSLSPPQQQQPPPPLPLPKDIGRSSRGSGESTRDQKKGTTTSIVSSSAGSFPGESSLLGGVGRGRAANNPRGSLTPPPPPPKDQRSSTPVGELIPVESSSQPQSASKSKSSIKVECVEAYGTNIYIGTADGNIIQYDFSNTKIDPSNGSDDVSQTRFLRPRPLRGVNLGQGKKKVEQLIAFPTVNKLVVLINGIVMFLELSTLVVITGGSFRPITKGNVTCVTYDELFDRFQPLLSDNNNGSSSSSGVVLTVCKQTQLVIYRLTKTELRPEFEYRLHESVVTISQQGWSFCLADCLNYKVIIIDPSGSSAMSPQTQQRHYQVDEVPLVPIQEPYTDTETGQTVSPPRPRTLSIGSGNFMFLAAPGGEDDGNVLGVITNSNGEPTGATIQFTQYPKSLVYNDPYIVSAYANGVVEIYQVPDISCSMVGGGTAGNDKPVLTLFANDDDDDDNDNKNDNNNNISEEDSMPFRFKQKIRRLCNVSGLFLPTLITDKFYKDKNGNLINASTTTADISTAAAGGGGSGNIDTSPASILAQSRILIAGYEYVGSLITTEAPLTNLDDLLDQDRDDANNSNVEKVISIVNDLVREDISYHDSRPEISYILQKAGLICFKKNLLDDAFQCFRRSAIDPRILISAYSYIYTPLAPIITTVSSAAATAAAGKETEMSILRTLIDSIPLAKGIRHHLSTMDDIEVIIKESAKQFTAGDRSDSNNNDPEQEKVLLEVLGVNANDLLIRYLEYARQEIATNPYTWYYPDTTIAAIEGGGNNHGDDDGSGGAIIRQVHNLSVLIDTALVITFTYTEQYDEIIEFLDNTAQQRSLQSQTRSGVAKTMAKTNVDTDIVLKYMMDNQKYYAASLIKRSEGDIQGMLTIWQQILDSRNDWKDSSFGGNSGMKMYLDAVVDNKENQDLVLSSFKWLLFGCGDPTLAISKVLPLMLNETITKIDEELVFEKLKAKNKDDGDDNLRAFIEAIISADHPKAQEYERHLLELYIRDIKELYKKKPVACTDHLSGGDVGAGRLLQCRFTRAQLDLPSLTFRRFIQETPGLVEEFGQLVVIRKRLISQILDRHSKIDPAHLLAYIHSQSQYQGQEDSEDNGEGEGGEGFLGIERAILNAKLGNTEKCVDILIHQVGDFAEAEIILLHPEFENSLAQISPSASSNNNRSLKLTKDQYTIQLHKLLDIYLALPDEDISMRLISMLLTSHSSQFTVSKVISQIPEHWPLSIVESFVRQTLGYQIKQCHQSDILRSIYQSNSSQVRESWLKYTNGIGPIVVRQSRTCTECGKILGSDGGGMFAVLGKTKRVYHVNCIDKHNYRGGGTGSSNRSFL